MVKVNYLSILSLILAITGFIFSMEFQGMAYLGKDGTITMQWYWLGTLVIYFNFNTIFLSIVGQIKKRLFFC